MNDIKNEPRKKKSEDKESTDPVHTIREGAIGASIWLRQSPSGFGYYDFTVSRSWKSLASGKTGYSKGFFDRNEEELVSVIRKVSEWIRTEQPKLANPEVDVSQAA